ncbi:uncharacterized protein N7482_003636 [Penicillium canariense]|uniref:3-hydroxyacyl-CoA dehydrogenase n=1 Tax=Penicillium canariense TaxID=189055 RepID=A0A9W9LNU3_9EURO|nr:uncharacterized protein N7482_003636 [Penicillium canariense]KAJ5168042.1 hypothetical protein N7482_003636 [Penicillium canariense]
MSHHFGTIGVVGTGVIGASWTALFLARGLKVIVSDPAPGASEKLAAFLEKEWPTMEKLGLSEGASLENYKFVPSIDPYLEEIDILQENAPERLEFKRQLFAHLDANTPKETLLLSSSSGLPASKFVTDCKNNPSRILIGHPFNPPHLVPLVEVVPHPATGDAYAAKAMEFYKFLGKSPVLVKKETPGFIANRLQAALCKEAYSLVERGIISASDLDTTVTSGVGLRWALTGPFMTNTLGGGGSFKHFMDHLGPALQSWDGDMQENAFDFSSEKFESLGASVQEWMDKVDVDAVAKERDDFLLQFIEAKSKATTLK